MDSTTITANTKRLRGALLSWGAFRNQGARIKQKCHFKSLNPLVSVSVDFVDKRFILVGNHAYFSIEKAVRYEK